MTYKLEWRTYTVPIKDHVKALYPKTFKEVPNVFVRLCEGTILCSYTHVDEAKEVGEHRIYEKEGENLLIHETYHVEG